MMGFLQQFSGLMLALGVALGTAVPSAWAASPPLQLDLEVVPDVVLSRKPITIEATLTARTPTTICLLKDPMAQFDFTLRKTGAKASEATISLQPVTTQLPDGVQVSPYRPQGIYQQLLELAEGESYTLRMNLSRRVRVRRLPPGEYVLDGRFSLCHPATFALDERQRREALQIYPGKTLAIPAKGKIRFYQSD